MSYEYDDGLDSGDEDKSLMAGHRSQKSSDLASSHDGDDSSGSVKPATQSPSGFVSWFTSATGDCTATAPLPGFRKDPPEAVLTPMSYKVDTIGWLKRGFFSWWRLSVKARILSFLLVLLFSATTHLIGSVADRLHAGSPLALPITLPLAAGHTPLSVDNSMGVSPGMEAAFLGPQGGAPLPNMHETQASAPASLSIDKALEKDISLVYVFSHLLCRILSWIVYAPFFAVLFQTAAAPAAFSTEFTAEAVAAAAADAEDPDAAKSAALSALPSGFIMGDHHVRAYLSALSLLWPRALTVGLLIGLPSAIVRLCMVFWGAVLGPSHGLFLMFCCTAIYVALLAIEFFFMWTLPYFVDHPSHGAVAVATTSTTLSERGAQKLTPFGLAILSLVIATLVLEKFTKLVSPLILLFIHAVIAVAYADIMYPGSSCKNWGQVASLGWLPPAAAEAVAAESSDAIDRVYGSSIRDTISDAAPAPVSDDGFTSSDLDATSPPLYSSSPNVAAPASRTLPRPKAAVVDPDTEETGPSLDSDLQDAFDF